ncbi:MAG: hypothetical protein RIG63_28710 [Coleofasciculus chthonoplastes F3-SA18-01]
MRHNERRHLMTVLIFDQFEEFFFVCTDTAARKPFFEFLSDCLNSPYLKIILSLREDYLHYLLECERLAVLLKPVYRNLDELLAGGCDWLKAYLASHPEARDRLPVCQE